MALSRIWSAFIIISVIVAAYHWLGQGNETIFNKMVVGRADDSYPYVMVGANNGDTSAKAKSDFAAQIKPFGFVQKDSAKDARYIITDDANSDTIRALKRINPDVTVH